MKELSIEEKAKRYDEAIEKLHEIITMDNKPVNPKEIGEYLFTELKESKDERIRKAIIKHFKVGTAYTSFYGFSKSEIINYLDEQGEQKPTEWSEKDEKTVHLACEFIRHHSTPIDSIGGIDCSALIERLKSLRPQNSWKPSDEQMNTLEYYMHNLVGTKHKEILFGLYTDLKKLKGE